MDLEKLRPGSQYTLTTGEHVEIVRVDDQRGGMVGKNVVVELKDLKSGFHTLRPWSQLSRQI